MCEVYVKVHFPAVSARLTFLVGFSTRFFLLSSWVIKVVQDREAQKEHLSIK